MKLPSLGLLPWRIMFGKNTQMLDFGMFPRILSFREQVKRENLTSFDFTSVEAFVQGLQGVEIILVLVQEEPEEDGVAKYFVPLASTDPSLVYRELILEQDETPLVKSPSHDKKGQSTAASRKLD